MSRMRRLAPLLALLCLLSLPPDARGDAFAVLPERAQDLLAETLREMAASDRDDTLDRLGALIDRIGAERPLATREGRRELDSVLSDLAAVARRVERRVAVSRAEMLEVCAATQEGIAFHYRGRAEALRQRGLPEESARALHLARLSADHARRFRTRAPEDLSGQFTSVGNRLAKNAGDGLANVFRGVSEGIVRVTGAGRQAEPKAKREPPPDPWR